MVFAFNDRSENYLVRRARPLPLERRFELGVDTYGFRSSTAPIAVIKRHGNASELRLKCSNARKSSALQTIAPIPH